MATIDFTGVKSGFELIPEGQQNVTVFAVEQKTSITSGFPYLNWTLKIQGGEHDGRKMFYTSSLQPQCLWSLKATLINLGYTKEQLEGQFNLDTTELLGRECVAVVVHEEYKGEMRDHVDKLLPAENGGAGNSGIGLYR
jgi:hypothetical protein